GPELVGEERREGEDRGGVHEVRHREADAEVAAVREEPARPRARPRPRGGRRDEGGEEEDERRARGRAEREADRRLARPEEGHVRREEHRRDPDDRPAGEAGHGYPPSAARSSSCTSCGFALPPVAFITWPTRKPSTC